MDIREIRRENKKFCETSHNYFTCLKKFNRNLRLRILRYIKRKSGQEAYEDFNNGWTRIILKNTSGNPIMQGSIRPTPLEKIVLSIDLWNRRCHFDTPYEPLLDEKKLSYFDELFEELKPFTVKIFAAGFAPTEYGSLNIDGIYTKFYDLMEFSSEGPVQKVMVVFPVGSPDPMSYTFHPLSAEKSRRIRQHPIYIRRQEEKIKKVE